MSCTSTVQQAPAISTRRSPAGAATVVHLEASGDAAQCETELRFLKSAIAFCLCASPSLRYAVFSDEARNRHTGSPLDPGHPWRPPFGLERIGRPVVVVCRGQRPAPTRRITSSTAFLKGKQGASYPVRFPTESPYSARVTLDRDADELVFSSDRKPPEKPVELARQAIHFPDFEAESIARPDAIINPVDLGTILVPSGWLLLGPGQSATLDDGRDQPHPGLATRAH